MSAREFTKGPWVHCLQSGWRVEWDGAYRNDGWIIGEFEGPDAEANARLAAAAPELYDALKVFAAEPLSTEPGHDRTRLFSFEDLDEKIRLARAAIAKAEGRG